MIVLLALLACDSASTPGADGAPGQDGADGAPGSPGADGAPGADAEDLCLSVRDFGAVGDGVADDTVAIQAAIDALLGWTDYGVGSYGRVCLPAGTYRITDTLRVPDFVTLQGEGMWSSVLAIDPDSEPMSAIARLGENAAKNNMFFDIGVFLSHADSVAFDLTFMTRAVVERCLVYNTAYVYGDDSAPPGGTGVMMEADASHSGYDNRVFNNEMWGLDVGVLVGPAANAAAIQNNTITGGNYAVYISDESADHTDNTRVTHNRFEAMDAAFIYAGGQEAVIAYNRLEAYDGDALSAAIVMPETSRWNEVGFNYVSLASTPAYEVLDSGENNSWLSTYTRVQWARGAGDNLEARVVRIGDDLARGLTLTGSYIALGSTVRLASTTSALSSGGAIDPSSASHVSVTGPASSVTLGTTGVDVGTVLVLTGSGASVTIVNGSTADITGSAITLGSGSGYYSGITLIYSPVGKWVEVSRSGQRS